MEPIGCEGVSDADHIGGSALLIEGMCVFHMITMLLFIADRLLTHCPCRALLAKLYAAAL
ncbi:hypothetical protein [Allorhizocola rhizosphaerae]|uniref:hypothetical protein n=1 Tax=Allorhizocola rhizosphaerae TaxID=1872709 RepID=UPI0013C31DC1|nr:hypothetical protein [Allorhizocola rhizosphaerae]